MALILTVVLSLGEKSVNSVYYFSISNLRTDLHPMIIEVNGMGWELGREGGRSEESFT